MPVHCAQACSDDFAKVTISKSNFQFPISHIESLSMLENNQIPGHGKMADMENVRLWELYK